MTKEISIGIKGMHCNSCAQLIRNKLTQIEGINSAEVSFKDENAKISFDEGKVSEKMIEDEIAGLNLGYSVVSPASPSKGQEKQPKSKPDSSLKQGIIYGIMPHIGCIGFIAASVLGATVAAELFKPLLLNPWFFHILILISLVFATISSVIYLRNNGLLSWEGVKRKKKYLATMYGSTLAVNLLLFFFIFPLTANLDTGSFANSSAATSLAGLAQSKTTESIIRLQVAIPCPGHAPLISGELKKISGVTGVKFDSPNYFSVAFDPAKTSKQQILSLDVFNIYKATVVSESAAQLSPAAAAPDSADGSNAAASPAAGGESQVGCGCGAR